MIHPHIPITLPDLAVRQGEKGLTAIITHEGQTHSFSLPIGHAERALSNALLHLTSGINLARIIDHFNYHTLAESSCPCCKLEGRILSSSGRKRPSDADRAIAARTAQRGGTVQVRHIKPNLSGAQLRAWEIAYGKREAKAKRPSHPEPQKFVKARIEDLI